MNASPQGDPVTVRVAVLPGGGRPDPARVARAVQDAFAPAAPVRVEAALLPGGAGALARAIRGWCDRERVDVVLTVGRSGHRATDYAPEATAPLIDRALPGIEERMYLAPPRRPDDLLHRGRAGLRRGTLVVNLPDRIGRVAAIARFLAPLLRHALEKARGSDRECGGAA